MEMEDKSVSPDRFVRKSTGIHSVYSIFFGGPIVFIAFPWTNFGSP